MSLVCNRKNVSTGHHQEAVTGYPRKHSSFPIHLTLRKKQHIGRFDAIYIPSNFCRDGICISPDLLNKMGERIYVIPSTDNVVDIDSYQSLGIKALDLKIEYYKSCFFSLSSSQNPSFKVTDEYDLPLKRNLALKHAAENGYRYIFLLDDDISVSYQSFVNALHLLRDGAGLVGFYVLQYADVSTVDHLHRKINGGISPVSVGGNCLAIDTNKISGFFPYLYNEDWLFMYCSNREVLKKAAGFAKQEAHAPWLNLRRIRYEQFGDVLASGILVNQEKGFAPLRGCETFWHNVYTVYYQRLLNLRKKEPMKNNYKLALDTAINECERFTASDLLAFAEAYNEEIRSYRYAC